MNMYTVVAKNGNFESVARSAGLVDPTEGRTLVDKTAQQRRVASVTDAR
jgi:hypothetical protein